MGQSKDYEKWYKRYMMDLVDAGDLSMLVGKGKITEPEKQEIVQARLDIYGY